MTLETQNTTSELTQKITLQVEHLKKVRAAYDALRAAGVTSSQEQLDAIYRMTLKRIAKYASDFFKLQPSQRKPIQSIFNISNEMDYTVINQLIEEFLHGM